ncbi:MAG: hypothetical protein IKU34_09840 [Clostridia bacterium]|nr:hypothetical protein [Clostridia bacterium]
MKQINLREHGILPGNDATLALYALFDKHPQDAVFVFEPGDYFFSPKLAADYRLSNSDMLEERKLGILMKGMKNVVLEGNGARLLFCGHMQPVTMDHCENATMRGFTIDWEKPLIAEGVVTAYDETSVDLFVDPIAFPHRFTGDWLEFDAGNGEWYPLTPRGQIQFDAQTRTVRRDTGDKYFPERSIKKVGECIYRFRFRNLAQRVDTAVGNIFVLRHNERMHAGLFAEKCRNVTFAEITIHSCGGLGCLAQFCDTVTYDRVSFVPNEKAGRRITSGRDDGMHVTCCRGTVTITRCSFLGLMDDPINVHGCCVAVEEIVDSRTLRCRYMHQQAMGFAYWAEPGDEIAFIARGNMQTIHTAKAEEYELTAMDTFLLTLKEDLPQSVTAMEKGTLALDNLTNTAAFTCMHNRFGSCRARGVLVSTPKPVRIAENLFESSGSAILVAGDSNYWFESGACRDVRIENNVFTASCLSSMYQFCEGIVSICPVVPVPETDKPYHSHITIRSNVFDSPDVPVLYAFSCEGLVFEDNRIFKAYAGKRWHPGKAMITLKYCRDAKIANNCWVGDFVLRRLETKLCAQVCAEE